MKPDELWGMIGAIFGGLSFLLTLIIEWYRLGIRRRIIIALIIGISVFIAIRFIPTLLSPQIPMPSVTPTSAIAHSVTAIPESLSGNLIYEENFDSGFAHGFDFYSGDWNIIDDGTGNNALQMSSPSTCCANAQFWSTNLSDGIVEFRFKVISGDYQAQLHVLEFSFRNGTNINGNRAQYQLTYDPEEAFMWVIYQENGGAWEPLEGSSGSGTIQTQKGSWIILRVEFQGENIRVFVNGNPFINAVDSRIKMGALNLGANGPIVVLFDDLRVWETLK